MSKFNRKISFTKSFCSYIFGKNCSWKKHYGYHRCFKKVVAINDNIRFLIVGGGPQLEELKEYVKNDHIEPYVIFTGPQSGEMVPAHYHISNMFISASLSETQGLTYIEAMASSISVIARYDDQLVDVIDDGKNGFFL